MNVTVEKLPKCLTEVSADFPSEDVSSQKASITSSFSSQAQIKGFRAGKAPKRVVEKRYEKEIEGELEHQFLNKLIQHTVKEEEIDFLTVKDRKFIHQEDGSVKAVISLIVAPDFELPEYKGIELSAPEVNVTEDDVEAEILKIRQQQAQYPTKEEGALESDDIAVISFSSTCEGKDTKDLFEESITPYDEKDEYWIKAGDDHFLPGFSSELINMVAGSEKVVAYTFADDFGVEVLQGKTFDYTVTLKEIKFEELPEVEAMVKQLMGEEATEESFRERVESYLTQQQEKSVNDIKVNTILEKISEGLEFDLPEDYLAAEAQSHTDRLVNQSMQYGMDEEAVTNMQDTIIETAKVNAEKSLKNHFILQKIAQKEEVAVSDEEVSQRIFMEAYQKGEDPQKALVKAKKEGADHNYRQSLILDKVVDFLINEAKITVENATEENDA